MNHLVSRGLTDIAQRLWDGAALAGGRFALSAASLEEAETGFVHTLARYRRTITLEAEFRAAERALADEMNEENWTRLQAIHAQMQMDERPESPEDAAAGPQAGQGAGF